MKDSIDKVCADLAEKTVGASCLVYKDGQELYSGCFGTLTAGAGTTWQATEISRTVCERLNQ